MLIYRVETVSGAGPWVDGNVCQDADFATGAGYSWCEGATSASGRVHEFNAEANASDMKPRFGFATLEQLFMYTYPHDDTNVSDDTLDQLLRRMVRMCDRKLYISVYDIPKYAYDALCGDHTQVVFKLKEATLLKRIDPTGAYMTQRIYNYQRQMNELLAA